MKVGSLKLKAMQGKLMKNACNNMFFLTKQQ